MQISPIQGNLSQTGFFVYAAADTVYFDVHAKPLINSVLRNTQDCGVHIHIYDPRPDQIEFCSQPRVSCTYEFTDAQGVETATQYWLSRTDFSNDRQRQMFKKGVGLGAAELTKLIKQTYYACVRFIRLEEILPKHQRCLAIDVDGLVRAPFEHELGDKDFYLYEKPKDGTHLAGAMLFTGLKGSRRFLQEYAAHLRASIEQDDIYWFLDQVLLDRIVPNYNKGLLPMSYIDWAMRSESAIWSAKGKRKELDIFKQEQQRYM
jgi:hypothetical protein